MGTKAESRRTGGDNVFGSGESGRETTPPAWGSLWHPRVDSSRIDGVSLYVYSQPAAQCPKDR